MKQLFDYLFDLAKNNLFQIPKREGSNRTQFVILDKDDKDGQLLLEASRVYGMSYDHAKLYVSFDWPYITIDQGYLFFTDKGNVLYGKHNTYARKKFLTTKALYRNELMGLRKLLKYAEGTNTYLEDYMKATDQYNNNGWDYRQFVPVHTAPDVPITEALLTTEEVVSDWANMAVTKNMRKDVHKLLPLAYFVKNTKKANMANTWAMLLHENGKRGMDAIETLAKEVYDAEMTRDVEDYFQLCRHYRVKPQSKRNWLAHKRVLIAKYETRDLKIKVSSQHKQLQDLLTGWELIQSGERLREEGIQQKHCVAAYANSVNRGECSIWHYEGYTFEIVIDRGTPLIVQCRGKYNESPSEKFEKQITQDFGIQFYRGF